ncbi:MAG: YncE family protein [Actinobacteria bacterium]|nr:YncE family protein [Actinomycetota bacterium]
MIRARRRPARLVLLAGATAVATLLPALGAAGEGPEARDDQRQVMFVGNNWEGTADVIDTATYERLVRIDVIPDREERMAEIRSNPDRLAFYLAIQQFVGEGNDQYVDDMFTNHEGTEVYVSRPSFADVVAISLDTHEILWRFPMEGYRSDHMGISPDGAKLLVSDSTANVVHELDTATGEKTGEFASGDSPHENTYDADGSRVLHASIGRVYTPTDREELGLVRDTTKGERYFQMVDADTLEILERWDMGERLAAAGHEDMSAAVRPMAVHPDERLVYFQVSFHHGFVEFDLEAGEVLRVADLPVSEEAESTPREEYLLDSAHHGLAIDPTGEKLCAAGTMSDYTAIVDRGTFEHTIASEGTKPYWSTNGPDGTTCWVSYSGDDEVAVIDYATEREVVRIPVGDHPQRVRNGVILEAFLAGAPAEGEREVSGGSGVVEGPAPEAAAEPGLPATGAPAALALAGLGGLAGAAALRRRRA